MKKVDLANDVERILTSYQDGMLSEDDKRIALIALLFDYLAEE